MLRDLATSTAVIPATWGALGGATDALTTRMRLRDAQRHILLGGLIAAESRTPMQAMTDGHGQKPELFKKHPYLLAAHSR